MKLFPPSLNTSQSTPHKPTSTITKPTAMSKGYMGTMEDILNLPYEPLPPSLNEEKFKENLKDILDLPQLVDTDYEEDSGDENHMDNFVSLSDDENTVNEKRSRAEYNFRKRVHEKKKGNKQGKPYNKLDE